MSVRVVARVRPLLPAEIEKDQIVSCHTGADGHKSVIKIPNPKNLSEEYSFQFSSVYDQDATQQEIFEAEVVPTIRHLFLGFDVTLFAYGSTGCGKTHTMRGGKAMADRGMIPRLLSNIYRKGRAIEKSTNGETTVEVCMSYYEIYNDRVYDLFDAPEKRTPTGLPIREAEGGKTIVVGLSEVSCSSLKEFETLYDKANANRSTGATKLNAHSSRSHAILCVRVIISSPAEIRSSTVSAIDLAGSEDNRRTGNGKERMAESASINKSLFVLAQCVEAIGKKQQRIPYRESKMTRILSLGQNNGFTIMILNLAPVKSYHLDTVSSLNVANRTKKIEVREVENEPLFKGPPRPPATASQGAELKRQPLRPLTSGVNVNLIANRDTAAKSEKPAKSFAVFSDKPRPTTTARSAITVHKTSPLKRTADQSQCNPSVRPLKSARPNGLSSSIPSQPKTTTITAATLESLVEKKVSEILAARDAVTATTTAATIQALPSPAAVKQETAISAALQARLDSIERRLEGAEGERAEGLSYLFMAKQHQARGEDGSALKMYELATRYFPENEKLIGKIEKLRAKMMKRRGEPVDEISHEAEQVPKEGKKARSGSNRRRRVRDGSQTDTDESYRASNLNEDEASSYGSNADDDEGEDEYMSSSSRHRSRAKKTSKSKSSKPRAKRLSSPDPLANSEQISALQLQQQPPPPPPPPPTPRTSHLLSIINSRDISQIRSLPGLGAKRAEGILEYLRELDLRTSYAVGEEPNCVGSEGEKGTFELTSWNDLVQLRGVGKKTLEGLRGGVVV